MLVFSNIFSCTKMTRRRRAFHVVTAGLTPLQSSNFRIYWRTFLCKLLSRAKDLGQKSFTHSGRPQSFLYSSGGLGMDSSSSSSSCVATDVTMFTSLWEVVNLLNIFGGILVGDLKRRSHCKQTNQLNRAFSYRPWHPFSLGSSSSCSCSFSLGLALISVIIFGVKNGE